jgi:hypothetical protein
MITWIIDKIITAYILSTSIFLFIIIFYKASCNRRNTFLNKSNLIIIILLLVNTICCIIETIGCIMMQIKSDTNNSQGSFINCNQHGISIFLFAFLFAFLFQTLFFFRKYRMKISFTVISILFLFVFIKYEGVVVFITSFYRDYLPSSWSTYYDDKSSLIWTPAFTIIYFIVCWTNKISFARNMKC